MIKKKSAKAKRGQYPLIQLLSHIKLENTIRYLGIEIDDALDMA